MCGRRIQAGLILPRYADMDPVLGHQLLLFEAFDEPWKSPSNPTDSENHFGLFTIEGEAKYAIWSLVEDGVFEGLTRDGKPIKPTYSGQRDLLDRHVLKPTH